MTIKSKNMFPPGQVLKRISLQTKNMLSVLYYDALSHNEYRISLHEMTGKFAAIAHLKSVQAT